VDPDNDSDKRIKRFKVKARLSRSSAALPTVWKETGWSTFQVLAEQDSEPIHLRASTQEVRTRWLQAIRGAIASISEPVPRNVMPQLEGTNFRMPSGVAPPPPTKTPEGAISGDDDEEDEEDADVADRFVFQPYSLPNDNPGASGESPRGGLTQIMRMKLEHALRRVVRQSRSGYAIMVVDRPGMRALAGVARTSELVDMGIVTVESLEKTRQPIEGLDVIYFISPDYVYTEDDEPDSGGVEAELNSPRAFRSSTRHSLSRPGHLKKTAAPSQLLTSIQRLRADFPNKNERMWNLRRRDPVYKGCGVHLLFVSKPEDPKAASEMLAESASLRKQLIIRPKRDSVAMVAARSSGIAKTRSNSEALLVNSFFVPYLSSGFEIMGSHQFSFNMANTLGPLLTRSADELLPRIAKSLAEFCFSLNEFPYIRYSQSSPTASTIAHLLGDQLEELIRNDPTWFFHGQMDPSRRSTLLIMGRLEDVVPPLLHDFTLRCLVNDTMGSEVADGVLMLKGSDKSIQFPLSVQNSVWRQYRHQHIEDAVAMAQVRLRELSKYDTASIELRKDGAPADITREQILNLGEYSEEKAKVGQLQTILTTIFNRIAERNLLPMGEDEYLSGVDDGMTSSFTETEQLLATGINEQGREFSAEQVATAVEGELIRCTELVLRVRLLALVAVSNYEHLNDVATRQRLFTAAELADERIEKLLLALSSACSDNRALRDQLGDEGFSESVAQQVKEKTKSSQQIRDILGRYQSRAKSMAQATLKGELPLQSFPFVRVPPEGFQIHERIQSDGGSGKTRRVGVSVRRREGERSAAKPTKPRVGGVLRRMLQQGAENKTIEGDEAVGDATIANLLKRKGSGDLTEASGGAGAGDGTRSLGTEAHRLIVFVAGGISLMEAEQLERLNDEFSGRVDIISGGTNLVDATSLVDETLDSGVIELYT